jgi:hypothetical protein
MATTALGTTTASNPAPSSDPYAEQNKAIKQQNAQNQQAWQSQQPMVDGNNQSNFIPLNKNAYNVQNQQMNTTMGNDAVLQKLQGTALNQQQPSSMPLLQQKTNDLLANPNQNYNPVAYNQMQMEQFDRDQSKAMEAARQQLGDTSQSGELKNEFLKNLLTTNQNRSDKKIQLDYDAMQKEQENLLAALGQGRSQAQLENDTTAANIGNLVSARGAAEGERAQNQQQSNDLQKMAVQNTYDVAMKNMDTDSQKMLTELKGKIDEGTQIRDQDWKSAEAVLDREQAIALQKGDRDTAMAIETLKGEISAKAQESEQRHQNTQRELTQIYNTNERLDIQNYETNMKYIDNELYAQRSQGDAEIAKTLKTLDAQLEEAKANGDVTRTNTINAYKAQLEADAAKTAFNNTKEAMNLQAQIDEAKAVNDQGRVKELETLKAAQAETFAQNRAAEATVAAQKKFDYDWLMQNNDYSHDEKMANITAEIAESKAQKDDVRTRNLMSLQASIDFDKMNREQGHEIAIENLRGQIASASAAKDFEYATALKAQEIKATVEEAAKDRAIQLSELALKQDAAVYQRYEQMKATDPAGAAKYLRSELAKKGINYNPVDAYEQAKNSLAVDFKLAQDQWLQTHKDLQGFNESYNNSMYGDKTQEEVIDQIVTGQLTYQQLKNNPIALKEAQQNAPTWEPAQKEEGFGSGSKMMFQSVPEMNTPFKYGQGTVMRTSDVMTKKVVGDDDLQYFTAVDLSSGKTITITTHQ